MARMTSFSDDDRDEEDLDREDENLEEEEEEEDRDDDRGRGSRRRDRGDEVDDDDGEGEEEEEEEEEPDDEDLEDLERVANGGRGGMVPYPRLAAMAEKNHQLTQALLDQLATNSGKTGTKDEKPPVDVAKLREQYEDALLEGDKAKARELADQIDEANLSKAEERALKRFREEEQQRQQEAFANSMRQASDTVLRKYPSLNDFETDPDAADDMERIIVERDLLMRRGVPGPKAMRQAADKVMGAGDETGERRGSSARDKRRRQERESLRERARTASRIPPKTGGNGTGQRGRQTRDSAGLYTSSEVANMSEKEKARARGDFDV